MLDFVVPLFQAVVSSCSIMHLTNYISPNELCSLVIKYWILHARVKCQYTISENNTVCKCCRLSHFDYVKSDDLERIGMGKPAIRRLVDAVKKRNRKKSLFEKVLLLSLILQTVVDKAIDSLVIG